MFIIKTSSPMYLKPTEESSLETECLFGETISVLDTATNWYLCKLHTDNYHGWLKKKDLGHLLAPTHRVISIRSFLYINRSIKSPIYNYMPLGAKLTITEIKDKWAKVCLPNNFDKKSVYILKKDIVPIDFKIKDWVSIAEKLIGTPYKWGGRNSLGIDCSALLQLSYQNYGHDIPRNTTDQMEIRKNNSNLEKLKRGFAVFWKGHVGIMVDNLNCIHANAFHMKTVVEPLKTIIVRMKDKYPIIKIIDLN